MPDFKETIPTALDIAPPIKATLSLALFERMVGRVLFTSSDKLLG